RQIVNRQVRSQTSEAVNSSVRAFDHLQKQQLLTLQRTASMMAELPTLKAVLATDDAVTIQDASAEFWSLSGSDLMVLVDRSSGIMALHTSAAETRDGVRALLK